MTTLERLIEQPLLALAPAALLLALYLETRSRACLLAMVGWLLYCMYEESVRRRILCSGACDVRVDLLLLYPLLTTLSLAGLLGAAVRFRSHRR